jgi:hypothetical protein
MAVTVDAASEKAEQVVADASCTMVPKGALTG